MSLDARIASLIAFSQSRADAPAPPKDRITGSDKNEEGSAKNKSGDISLDESTISALKKKVEEHNAAMRERKRPEWTHVRLPSLKAVYRRGAGAFSTSHRPGMTRDRWAMARVNAFLTLARRGRPENSKYVGDNDLLHSDHPRHSNQSRAMGTGTNAGGGALPGTSDCGRDEDGKFSSGNTCAGGAIAETAKGAVAGGIKGAITGLLTGGPVVVKPAAAIGAATGAVKGLYDNQMRPTRVRRVIDKIGMTEKSVGSLVGKLGGSPKSNADVKGNTLRLSIRDKEGKKTFQIEIDKKTITVYPRRATGELNSKEIDRVKKIADESTPKSISVVVKASSSAYVAKLVKSGFTMAAGHAKDILLATYSTPLVHSVAVDTLQSLKKRR